MTDEISSLARHLAADPGITDYDLWRAVRLVEDELYDKDREGAPIPIRLLHARATLRRAIERRGGRT